MTNYKKNLFLILLILLSTIFIRSEVKASDPAVIFSMSCDRNTIYKNEEACLSLSVRALHEVNISTFKLSIKFDSEKLEFKDLSAFSPISDSEIKYNLNESMLNVVFLTEDDGINLQKSQEIKLIEFDFKALKSSNEKLLIDSEVEGVGNFDEKYLYTSTVNDIYINIDSIPKFDCRLSLLEPSEGTLSPNFSPDTFDYTVEVPADCGELDFETLSIDENASVKISKHKLKKSGEETKIKISVQSPDKKNKLVYHVTVKREPKDNKTENKKSKNSSARKPRSKSLSDSKSSTKLKNTPEINEQNLDIDPSDDARTLIFKENGFSFIIFGIVIILTFICLFLIWRKK